MKGRRFSNVGEMLDAVGDESLAQSVQERIASRRVISSLIAMRAAEDLPQAAIAKELGCSQSRISKIENGQDSDLTLRQIEAYARALDRHVHLCFLKNGHSLMDRVKYHAFEIRDCLRTVVELSVGDATMEHGAVRSHLETLVNLARLIVESAAKIPCLESEITRLARQADRPRLMIDSDPDSNVDLCLAEDDMEDEPLRV